MEQQGGESRRITIHRPEDFEGMRRAGRLAAETLDMIVAACAPGRDHGRARPALPRLHPGARRGAGARSATAATPSRSCTSINHVVCHGIPGERVLADGDIVNIDVTVILDGWHGDTSRMYVAGTPRPRRGC